MFGLNIANQLDEIYRALSPIDIRVTQRNGKKMITTISGFSDDHPQLQDNNITMKDFVTILKKKFSCNGSIQKDDEGQQFIQLSGNQVSGLKEYLVSKGLCDEDMIRVHG